MKNDISFQQLRTTQETEDSDTSTVGVDGPGRAEMPHR